SCSSVRLRLGVIHPVYCGHPVGAFQHKLCLRGDSRSSVIHSCRKYWNKAARLPVMPVSSSLTAVSTCGIGGKRQLTDFFVPPGRSGSSSPVPAYSGSNPELQ
ncbi:hypothetical protein Tsp_14479, partial [Trichinella spiralis]|uniref:hypothetical protein n=1 Tax=Trichinella spiralis TaxID=6334 RepID=UPI0001EFEDB9